MFRKKVGLALGSGGARGLAHIGVIEILRRENIPIDYIAGASAGSIIGAYYALNLEVDSLKKKVTKMTNRELLRLIDINSLTKSLIKGAKVEKFLRELLEDKTFSDVKIPLTIVATDLATGKEVHITEGNLTDAIMASICIPGVFPPRKKEHSYLVDGGVLNPTPVNVVKQMGADVIIGIDLTVRKPIKISNPSIVDVLMQSFDIIMTQNAKRHFKDLKDTVIIRPQFPKGITVHQFHESRKFISIGEKVAIEHLAELRKLVQGRKFRFLKIKRPKFFIKKDK